MLKWLYKHKTEYIVLLFSVIFIIIGCASLLRTYNSYMDTAIHLQEEQLMAIARTVSRNLEMHISNYTRNLNHLVDSNEFSQAEQTYYLTREGDPLVRKMNRYILSQRGYVAAMCAEEKATATKIWSDSKKKYELIGDMQKGDGNVAMGICKNQNNRYYFVLSMERERGLVYSIILDMKLMYENIVANVPMGDNGYIVIKDSKGMILMHYLVKEIGSDAILSRKEEYPNLNLDELESVLEHQKRGLEGVEIYNTYWWVDEPPKPVKKITAYTPASIGGDFLIVAALMDYDEISEPLRINAILLFGCTLLLVGGISIIVMMIIRVSLNNEKMERENQLLKEKNETLEEIHQKEEELSHNTRLQLIGTMTSGIAHEFSNLLTPIMGYSGLMLEDKNEDDEVYEDISEIYHASEKAKELIRQISSLSRKDTRAAYMKIEIDKIIKSTLKMVQSAKPPEVNVYQQLNCNGIEILGNETQIHQVILNLCINAFHALQEVGDSVWIQTKQISLQRFCEETNEQKGKIEKKVEYYVSITIEDNGCGMENKVKERIFDPFFTTKIAGEGTGLGLSVVQTIVENHKGRIMVESEVGKGSKFQIYLPVTQKEGEKEKL